MIDGDLSFWEQALTMLELTAINLIYAFFGGLVLIFLCWIAGHVAAKGFKFKISDQLREGNIAVGLAVLGIFLGLGIGLGLVIGLSMQ